MEVGVQRRAHVVQVVAALPPSPCAMSGRACPVLIAAPIHCGQHNIRGRHLRGGFYVRANSTSASLGPLCSRQASHRTTGPPTAPPPSRVLPATSPSLSPRVHHRFTHPSPPPSPPSGAPRQARLAPAASSSSQASSGPSSPVQPLPYSQETTRALRASKEQAVRQGAMFAGPDQLLLGILAAADHARARRGGGGGAGGGADASAAQLLEAALGGGDADSVREWLNEQTRVVAPIVYGSGGGSVSSSRLVASDVEFTGEAREVLAAARAGAEEMGSRSLGTYHLLLVLMGAGGTTAGQQDTEQELGAAEVAAEGSRTEAAAAAAAAGGSGPLVEGIPKEGDSGRGGSSSSSSGGGGSGSGGRGLEVSGLLPALLRAVGADTAALQAQLTALAESDSETPTAPGAAPAAYRDVVTHLRETYKRQAGLPVSERDDAAFRAALPRSSAVQEEGPEEEDPYE